MMRFSVALLVGSLLCLLAAVVSYHLIVPEPSAVAQSSTVHITAIPGQNLAASCVPGVWGQIAADGGSLGSACVAYTPTVPTQPTAQPTITPTPMGTVAHPNHCHAPTDHEHHDCAPQWLEDFSIAEFGHGIIYGGNETSSPMENLMKHNVFKGVTMRSEAGGEFHFRYHAGSNPMDRISRIHSHETAYLDTGGGITFLEGHYDCGDPNDPQRRVPIGGTDPGVRPIVFVVTEETWAANKRNEQWYCRTTEGGRGLDFDISIPQATTFYGGLAENATAHDMSTWRWTGGLGNIRGGGTTKVNLYDRIAQLPPGRHCATPLGRVGPCGDAYPMQWVISPTLAADLRPSGFGFSWIKSNLDFSKTYPCPGCGGGVPN